MVGVQQVPPGVLHILHGRWKGDDGSVQDAAAGAGQHLPLLRGQDDGVYGGGGEGVLAQGWDCVGWGCGTSFVFGQYIFTRTNLE